MTSARLTPRRQVIERPAVRTEALALISQGLTDAAVAAALSTKRISISRQTVNAFRHRHTEELEAMTAKVEKQVEDYAISRKVERIKALDDRWQRMRSLIEARANDSRYRDEPGYETGLMIHQIKGVGKGEDFQLIDLYVTDAALLAEMRQTERAAAEELGQMPKPAGDDRPPITVLLRNVIGIRADQIV